MDLQNQPVPPVKTRETFFGIAKEIIIFAIIAFGIVVPFRMYVAEPYVVSGASMDPTFATGDYLIVDKVSKQVDEIKRNSVVVFKYPGDTSKNFIKRVIGLPGETVSIKNTEVKIINAENPNGFTVEEPYLTHMTSGNFEVTLKGDEYFVMGDNRPESFDSRSWGPLERKYILGRPLLRLFPLGDISIFPGKPTTN